MFYSTNVLQKKGPLGAIWIAAHHDVAKKLTKLQILNTDIVKSAEQIENPEVEMALRLSSHLLVGLSRIYTRKVQFLFTDCNEALSKITLAFRPSNVDLGPVNKAQIKSITIDESALAGMDIDLDLDLQDADWLAPKITTSQPAVSEITMPETGGRKRGAAAATSWDEEDTLLGGGWGAGENPLDLAFEDAELPRIDDDGYGDYEAPEKHRSSDAASLRGGVADKDQGAGGIDQDIAADMPEFEMDVDVPFARPSEAHSSNLALTPGQKSLNDSRLSSALDATPVIGVKKAAAAKQKRRRAPSALDGATEIDKGEQRKWIMEPGFVQGLMRQTRELPLTRVDGQRRRMEELHRHGHLVEVLVAGPLSGYISSRLRGVVFGADGDDVDLDGLVVEPFGGGRHAKKRRAGGDVPAEEEEEGLVLKSRLEDGGGYDDGFGDNQLPDFDLDGGAGGALDDQQDDEAAAARQSRGGDAAAVGEEEGYLDVTGREEHEEMGPDLEDEQAKAIEQQERTKKVILMLQKSFKKAAGGSKALPFSSIVKVEEAAPSRHTAAVAFFECLGLHAKGMVALTQADAYGEINVASTQALLKFKA